MKLFLVTLIFATLVTSSSTLARAEIVGVTYGAHDSSSELSASVSELSTSDDYHEYRKYLTGEFRRIKRTNPNVKIRIFWNDIVSDGRFPSDDQNSGGSVQELANAIALDAGTTEIDGSQIKTKGPLRELTEKEVRYVNRANTIAYWIRVRGIAGYAAIHVFLTHSQFGFPKAIALSIAGGFLLTKFATFNTKNAELISNSINYLKLKTYSEEKENLSELKALIAKTDALQGSDRALYLTTVWFRSFLYETAYQGLIQTGLTAASLAMSMPPDFKLLNFIGIVFFGSIGEVVLSDRGVAAYQASSIETPHPIVEANVRIITTVASILSTTSTLISANDVTSSIVGVSVMTITGVGIIHYFNHVQKFQPTVNRISKAAQALVTEIRNGTELFLNGFCNQIMRSRRNWRE